MNNYVDQFFKAEVVKVAEEPDGLCQSVYSIMAKAIYRLPEKLRKQYLFAQATRELVFLQEKFSSDFEYYELSHIIKEILEEREEQSRTSNQY